MKTLISKLGALGDVVRTTVLLHELEGEIYWLTSESAKDLLYSDRISRVYIFNNQEDREALKRIEFDLVLSLDEEKEPLKFIENIQTKKLIGHFLDENGRVDYTSECNYWLDMSFISKRHSRADADTLKINNKKSIPQILIEIIGKEWQGQEYDLGITPRPENEVKGRVGLIDMSDSKWPNKFWAGYDELKAKLQSDGYEVTSLGLRPTVKEHIEDINNCELVVCGDTLGMHLALALKKKVVTLFNCTPPEEIHNYGRMKKMKSPLYGRYVFRRDASQEAQNAIPVQEVYSSVKEILRK